MANWFQSLLQAIGIGSDGAADGASDNPSRAKEGVAPQNAEAAREPALDSQLLQKMVKAAVNTHDDELDCDQCFAELDAFVEMHLNGKPAADALPLVEDHLRRCGDCREEFEALLEALQATT